MKNKNILIYEIKVKCENVVYKWINLSHDVAYEILKEVMRERKKYSMLGKDYKVFMTAKQKESV